MKKKNNNTVDYADILQAKNEQIDLLVSRIVGLDDKCETLTRRNIAQAARIRQLEARLAELESFVA